MKAITMFENCEFTRLDVFAILTASSRRVFG